MKNILALAVVAGMFAMASCGGAKKDDEKAKQDSIKKADSLAQVAKADSLKQDSIKKVEEMAKAKEDSLKAAEEAGKKPAGKK